MPLAPSSSPILPDAAAQALAAEQRLRAVLGHMQGFCYTVDRELVFRSSSGAGLSALGLEDGQLVGVRLPELWATTDPNYEPLACHERALNGIRGTYQDVCVGRSLEYHLEPLHDGAGEIVGVIGVGFDVTDREVAKQEQAKLSAQLRQAQKMEAIGRLAGGVAHDFNNLLTCIIGNLALAQRAVAADSPVMRHIAEAITAADSAATLTGQLLAFGRKQVIDPRPVNLSTLLERVQGMLRRLIGESITLRTRCTDELWSVLADPGQLEQVLVNLVINARDAIPGHGEIVVETRNLTVSALDSGGFKDVEPGNYVLLSVADSGRGMSDVVRARLFEPFFTTKATGEGTGLGLATVYGSVHQNGGCIRVESELGKGSTFHIFLPMIDARPAEQDSAVFGTSDARPEVRGGSETVLLVEDEPTLLELAHCTLTQLGYNVLPCGSADEALRAFGAQPQRIDLLVTDVVMPRMNGRELAGRMSSLQPGLAVLFSSGYGENVIAKQGVLESGVDFLRKPYRPTELALRVRAALDQRAAGPSSALNERSAEAQPRI
jgi:two-component system, cell cycle sensor histidine kinase and response regulator CckA